MAPRHDADCKCSECAYGWPSEPRGTDKRRLMCSLDRCLHAHECAVTRNCLGALEPAQRDEVLATVRRERPPMSESHKTTMTETYDPTNGRNPAAVKTKETVIRIDTFPDGVQVARGRIAQGETLNKSPGTYEMARYDVAVEMPFLPSNVDAALNEMEALTAARLDAFRRKIKAGIKTTPEPGSF